MEGPVLKPTVLGLWWPMSGPRTLPGHSSRFQNRPLGGVAAQRRHFFHFFKFFHFFDGHQLTNGRRVGEERDLGDSCLAMPVLRRAMVRAYEAQPPSLRKECASAPRSTRNMGCLVAVCRPTLLRRSYHFFSSASHPVSMITSSLRNVIYRLQKKKERLRVG